MAVVDASVAAAVILDLPWSAEARQAVATEQRLIAPTLFLVEVANTIWKSVRSGKLAASLASSSLRVVRDLVELRPDDALIEEALELSLRHDHPAYDCLYLALAGRDNATLLTADRRLAALSRTIHVSTVFIGA